MYAFKALTALAAAFTVVSAQEIAGVVIRDINGVETTVPISDEILALLPRNIKRDVTTTVYACTTSSTASVVVFPSVPATSATESATAPASSGTTETESTGSPATSATPAPLSSATGSATSGSETVAGTSTVTTGSSSASSKASSATSKASSATGTESSATAASGTATTSATSSALPSGNAGVRAETNFAAAMVVALGVAAFL